MDEDEEDYVFFGTPLPEIEDESVLRKKAAKELQVRDEKGRQRFHGAFTGGFSAGYFNTVGTKEGWAPSTFVSSRTKVSDRIQQNPEDFMDEEDFGEFGIATRKIHTASNFQDASDANTRKRKYVDTDAVIPGEAPLKDIVQPVRESIGIIILKKLGWRQGQGIGPRVKKYSSGTKVYGCSPFPDSAIPEEEEDPMSAAFTFAPKDTEGVLYQPKDNYFGLGYSGLSKQSVLQASFDPFAPTSTKSWLSKDKKKITISGQAFGVGAFEEDDEDIYGKDDMSQYDFSDLTLAGAEKPQKTIGSSEHSSGQSVLEGFHLASQPPVVKNHYPSPVLPANFKPIHLKSVSSVSQNASFSKSRHSLSSSDRSLLLGEKTFQKPSSSAPITQLEKISDAEQELTQSSSRALNFKPFPSDSAKQLRYEEYLKLKKSGDVHKLRQPLSMTEWEKQQEIEEFSKAATLFKPLSNVLSSRFESRSHLSVEHEVMSALQKLKNQEEKVKPVTKALVGTSNRTTIEWHPVSLLCKRMNVPNPYPNSSSSGTQSSKAKSVFDHLSVTEEKSGTYEKADSHVLTEDLKNNIKEASKTSEDLSSNIKQVPASSVKSSEEFPPADKRPPIDFFKDIFDNNSSDEEDNVVSEEANSPDKVSNSGKEVSSLNNLNDNLQMDASSSQKSSVVKNEQLSKKTLLTDSNAKSSSTGSKRVGFGVFANLDLDALNQRKPPERSVCHNVSKSESDKNEVDCISELSGDVTVKEKPKIDDVYGPEPPPNLSNFPLPSSSSFKTSTKKHSKHKSKHKHHKHKSKKKKKSSSRRYSDSSDSLNELDDVPPSLIIEMMKKLQKKKI